MNNLVGLFTEVMKYVGLDSFDVQVYADPSPGYVLRLAKKLDWDVVKIDQKEFQKEILDPFYEKIKNSQCLKDLTSDLTNQINDMSRENLKLIQERDSLLQYKQYYNLTYELNHGTERTKK